MDLGLDRGSPCTVWPRDFGWARWLSRRRGRRLDSQTTSVKSLAVKYEPESRSLQFASADELDAFHRELTGLLREVTISVSSTTKDANEARDRAREVLREFKVVTRILNAIRKRADRPDRVEPGRAGPRVEPEPEGGDAVVAEPAMSSDASGASDPGPAPEVARLRPE